MHVQYKNHDTDNNVTQSRRWQKKVNNNNNNNNKKNSSQAHSRKITSRS